MKKIFKLLRLILLAPAIFLFAAEGGAGGTGGSSNAGSGSGGSSTGGAGSGSAQGDQGGASGQGGSGGTGGQGGQGGGSGSGTGGKTFSEEEAERIAKEREERARRSALKSYFEQQGYSQEEVEQMLKADKEKREKEKTETQREKERADKAEAEKKTAIDTANAKLAKAAFLVQAVAVGIPSDRVNDAAELVRTQLSELKPDDKTGEFDEKEIKKIAEELVKAKPWLKGDAKGGNLGGGSNFGGGGDESKPGSYGEKMAKAKVAPEVKNDPWAAKRQL
ncbi:MAG: hypothetical protein GXY86_00570 [Firmicutes bacterium]|nr:hypothetical protein [Bacillota bacterium]